MGKKDVKKELDDAKKRLAEAERRLREVEAKESASGFGELEAKNGAANFGSFGGLFSGIADLLKTAERLAEKGESQGEIPFGKEGKAVYGFSARWLGGGRPTLQRFGNVRRVGPKLTIEEKREPLVDVFDEKDYLTVVAEVPGVEEKDVSTKVEGKKLTIATGEAAKTKYFREVELPAEASIENTLYKNGILEIRLKKKKEEKESTP